jgi:tetratricopeptide (TPR) repeat protein
MEGDHQTAKECYENALPHFQRANHRGRIAETINNIATALIELGRPEDAYKILPEPLTYHQSTNDTWGLAFCREVFGFALFAIGDLAACRTAWRAARDGYDAVGHAQRGILVRLCLTGAALRESDIDTARVCLTEALDRIAGRAFHQEIADAICLCAQFAVATGDLEAATILFASAQRWIREWNVVLEPPIKFAAATAEARAREGLTAEVHAAATRLGDSLTVPLALSRARAAIAKNT